MNNGNKSDTNLIKLFLVDDDALFLKNLEIEFQKNADFSIETFATGELCLTNMSHFPDIIILDYHLDSLDKNAMNGIETLDRLKLISPEVPVVMLSSQDQIDVAINCMHHKATDYVVKNETAFMRLRKIITNIYSFENMEKQLNWYMERM